MSLGKPMGEKEKKSIKHALEHAMCSTVTSIEEEEDGPRFNMKVTKSMHILIPDK